MRGVGKDGPHALQSPAKQLVKNWKSLLPAGPAADAEKRCALSMLLTCCKSMYTGSKSMAWLLLIISSVPDSQTSHRIWRPGCQRGGEVSWPVFGRPAETSGAVKQERASKAPKMDPRKGPGAYAPPADAKPAAEDAKSAADVAQPPSPGAAAGAGKALLVASDFSELDTPAAIVRRLTPREGPPAAKQVRSPNHTLTSLFPS